VQGEVPLGTYHSHPQRYQSRLEVIKLYYQGWTKRSISHFLHVSRPTVDRWIGRFEAEHLAGLLGHKPGPQSPRKVWFPIMVEVYHLQKAHPDAGECRIWSLLAREDIRVPVQSMQKVPISCACKIKHLEERKGYWAK
jgi:transposase